MHDLERCTRHIGFGIARPGDAHFAEQFGDRFGARQIVGKGVVVEEEFLHLRKVFLCQRDFLGDIFGAAHAVTVAAHGLRPQAEGAVRFAAAAGVHRHVGVFQVADEIIFDLEVTLIDLGDEGQLIHVFECGALGVVHDHAFGVAV